MRKGVILHHKRKGQERGSESPLEDPGACHVKEKEEHEKHARKPAKKDIFFSFFHKQEMKRERHWVPGP
jgi:hypothetical protein